MRSSWAFPLEECLKGFSLTHKFQIMLKRLARLANWYRWWRKMWEGFWPYPQNKPNCNGMLGINTLTYLTELSVTTRKKSLIPLKPDRISSSLASQQKVRSFKTLFYTIVSMLMNSGLYYKCITIVIDAPSVVSKWCSKLGHHLLTIVIDDAS